MSRGVEGCARAMSKPSSSRAKGMSASGERTLPRLCPTLPLSLQRNHWSALTSKAAITGAAVSCRASTSDSTRCSQFQDLKRPRSSSVFQQPSVCLPPSVELSNHVARNLLRHRNRRRSTTMFSLIGVAAIILDIFALTDVMKSNRDTTSKILLMALILLFPIIAAGLYLLVFRDKGF